MARTKEDPLLTLLHRVANNVKTELHVGGIGKITAIDPPYIDVQPQVKFLNGDKRALWQSCWALLPSFIEPGRVADCPRGEHDVPMKKLKLNYKVGDHVMVAFLDRSIDNYDGSGEAALDSERTHSVNDGVVIGKVAQKGDFA